MAIEIRACRDRDEMTRYGDIVQYVFAENDREAVAHEVDNTQPEWTTCAFVDGKMATTMGTIPFSVQLNGRTVSMGGVTAVGTLPGYRRRGLLRSVMSEGLRTMHERGQPFAILWASMGAIYQRFGYGLASAYQSYTFNPRDVRLESSRPPGGSCDLVSQVEGLVTIKALYDEYRGPRNLLIDRPEPLWTHGVLRPREKGEPVHIAVYRDASGAPRGYMVYRTAERTGYPVGPNQRMDVRDFIALDMDAYVGLWEYIRGHDLVAEVFMGGVVPEDDPAPDLLSEPRMLNRRLGDAIWMRVIDVEQALTSRPYGAAGSLTLAIAGDEACPWNNSTWQIETDGTRTTATRTGAEPDLWVPINTLGGLLSGYRSARHYRRIGRLEARSPEAVDLADLLFRTEYAPFTPNEF